MRNEHDEYLNSDSNLLATIYKTLWMVLMQRPAAMMLYRCSTIANLRPTPYAHCDCYQQNGVITLDAILLEIIHVFNQTQRSSSTE